MKLHYGVFGNFFFSAWAGFLVVPFGVTIVKILITERACVLRLPCVDLHMVFHFLFPCKRPSTGRAIVWLFIHMNRLDVLVKYCHFVVCITT